jgi:PAS domain S-box-containing protein
VTLDLLLVVAVLVATTALAGVMVQRARAETIAAYATAARHHAVIRSMPEVGVVVFDRDLRWIQIEGEALARNGWRREELVGRRPTEVLGPERGAELERHYAAALAGEPSSFEWEGLRGGVYQVDVAPVQDDGGAGARGVCVLRDIGRAKRLQAELDAQHEFFAASLERLAEPVVIADVDGRITLVNAAARALHGPVLDGMAADALSLDVVGRRRLRHLDGEALRPGEAPLFRALHGEEVRDVGFVVESPDAGRRHVVISASPVHAPDDRPLGAVSVAVDMTDQYATEAALRASEARYRSVVDGVDDAVFQTDAGGRYTFLNEAFERSTGHAVESALGRPVWEFVHPDDRTAHTRALAPLLATRMGQVRHRYRCLTAGGEVRWAELRARAVPGGGVSGVIEDVTARRQVEAYDHAHEAVAGLLDAAGGTSPTMAHVLETLCRGLGWDAGELWTMRDEVLRATASWQASGARGGLVGDEHSLEVGEGGPGRAWALRRLVWVPDLSTERGCPRAAAAFDAGARSALLLPVVSGRRVHALIVLLSCIEQRLDPAAERALDAIGAKVALFLERADAEQLIASQALDLAELRARLATR